MKSAALLDIYIFCKLRSSAGLQTTRACSSPRPPPTPNVSQVLSLCVIAWQAIVAVVPASKNGAMSNNAEMKSSLPEGQRAIGTVDDTRAGDDGAAGETEVQRQARDGGVVAAESASSGGRRRSITGDEFAGDALRDLVRCLCGVIVGRWKQASSVTGRAPKKVWVLHAMEAAHALVRTLEVGHQ